MKNALRLKIFMASNEKEIRFFFLFILFFVLGQLFLYLSSSYVSRFLVSHNAWMSSKIINVITPDEQCSSQGKRLIGQNNFILNIEKGCDGIEAILLIFAAIAAFSMRAKDKLVGILLGSFIIYLLNLVRIVALFYTLKYRADLFDMMHIYIGQVVIIFVGVLFFITWAAKFARIDEPAG